MAKLNRSNHHTWGWFLALFLLIATVLGWFAAEQALARIVAMGTVGSDSANTQPATPFLSDNALNVDPDAAVLLRKAEQALAEKNYTDALIFLQVIVEKYGQTNAPVINARDTFGRRYNNVRQKIEALLSDPNHIELRKLYLMSANAEARVLLGTDVKSCRDRKALAKVVRQYFMADVGDDAAYQLGCLLLDDYRWSAACAMFRKVMTHPNWQNRKNNPRATVRPRDLYLRYALAAQRVYRHHICLEMLKLAREAGADESLLLRIEKELSQRNKQLANTTTTDRWALPFGSATGNGAMPSMDEQSKVKGNASYVTEWERSGSLRLPNRRWGGVSSNSNQQMFSRSSLVKQWKQNHWTPSQQVLFDDQRIYYKTTGRLLAVNTLTGQVEWESIDGKARRDRDRTSWSQSFYYNSRSAQNIPRSPEGLALFSDRVSMTLSMIDGVIYSIEMHDDGMACERMINQPNRGGGRQNYKRRGNALMMHEAKTGKIVGHFGRTRIKTDSLNEALFMTAPVPGESHIVTTCLKDKDIYLVVLDRHTRKLIYDPILLCGTNGSVDYFTPIGVAVDGRMAYVSPGQGAIFCVDLDAGETTWIYSYPKKAPPTNPNQFGGFGGRPNGIKPRLSWQDNAVFIQGGRVVVCPSDFGGLISLDQATGQLQFPIKMNTGNYVLGCHDGSVFVAGRMELRRYSVLSGKIQWRASVGEMTGRAAITGEYIYVPCNGSIMRLSCAGGKNLGAAKVTASRLDPVGNLYCDGERLIVVGMERLYALADSQIYLARLNKHINDKPDLIWLSKRAKLHQQTGQLELAVADLRQAVTLAPSISKRIQTNQKLFDLLLVLINRDPAQAENLLKEATPFALTPDQQQRIALARASSLHAQGQTETAINIYLSLLDSDGQGLIRQTDNISILEVASDLAARQALVRLINKQKQTYLPTINQSAQLALDRANSVEDSDERNIALWRIATGYPTSPATVEALNLATIPDQNKLTFELTELRLRQLTRTGNPNMTSAAMMATADLYHQKKWDQSAEKLLTKIVKRYTHVVVESLADGSTVTAADRANQKLKELATPTTKSDTSPWEMPVGPWVKAWEKQGGNYMVVQLPDAADSLFMQRHVLLYSQSYRRLDCLETQTGKRVWQIQLKKLDGSRFYRQRQQDGSLSGLRSDGHVLALFNHQGVGVFSMLTGKLLWKYPPTAPAQNNSSGTSFYSNSNQKIDRYAIGGGVVAMYLVNDQLQDQITVRDVTTGRVLWQRQFTQSTPVGMKISGGFLNVIADGGSELLVFDRFSGRLISRCSLENRQPNSPLLWSDGFMVYQTGSTARCIELGQCEQTWQQPSQSYGKMKMLNQRLCYLFNNRGDIQIIDIPTGKSVRQLSRQQFGNSVQDMAITPDGKELYCIGRGNNGMQLSIIDRESGSRRLQIQFGQNYGTIIPALTMARSGYLIPWLGRSKNGRSSNMEIFLYSSNDGKLNKKHKLPTYRNQGHFSYVNYPPVISGNVLIVTNHQGILAIRHDSSKAKKDDGKETTNLPKLPKVVTQKTIDDLKKEIKSLELQKRISSDLNRIAQMQVDMKARKALLAQAQARLALSKTTVAKGTTKLPKVVTQKTIDELKKEINSFEQQKKTIEQLEKEIIQLKNQIKPAQDAGNIKKAKQLQAQMASKKKLYAQAQKKFESQEKAMRITAQAIMEQKPRRR